MDWGLHNLRKPHNKWENDGLLQANDGKMLVSYGEILVNDGETEMLVNDCEMLVNEGKMSIWAFTHFTSSTSISPSLMSILPSLALTKQSFAHSTIIEKLHRLHK